MTVEEANKISELVNSIIVWGGMVDRMMATGPIDIEKFDLFAKRHNDAANNLLEMGIVVVQFGNQETEKNNAA